MTSFFSDAAVVRLLLALRDEPVEQVKMYVCSGAAR